MPPDTHKIVIKHKLLKKGGKIRSRKFRTDGYEHFNVRVYADGETEDLDRIEYKLHPTFPDPHRVVAERREGFPLDIWTWGEFDINVTLHFKDGSKEERVYSLAYSNELPAKESAYTNEGPASAWGSRS